MNYIIKGKAKGTIFCIHGNSSSAKVYETFLNSNDILQTKIAIDLMGHGENQPKYLNLDQLSCASQKKFLIAEISKIDDEILLIGNSLGGHLAIEVAQEIPNLKGLVIMGTPPVKKPINFKEAFVPVKALNTFFTEFPTEEEIIEAIDQAVINKKETPNIVSDFKKAIPLVRKAIATDIIENKLLNEYDIFTKLTVPKYIIAGDSDISINREYLELVKNNCESSCRIIDVKNCGHYPSIEKPFEFINIVKRIASKVFNS